MGKKLIIPGADFSASAIENAPFEFIVPAGQSITINGVTYGSNVESAYELDTVPQSGLNSDSAANGLKELTINAPFTSLVSRYVANQQSLKKFILKANATPTDTVGWFKGCISLEIVKGLNYIDFSAVTSVYAMFYACESLVSIDFTGVNLSGVSTFTTMFVGCSVLREVVCDSNNYNTLLSCLQTDLSSKTWTVNADHTLITGV